MNKSKYRIKHKEIRNNISCDVADKKSESIKNILLNNTEFKNAKTVFIYNAYGREVATGSIIKTAIELGKTVLIPECDINTETMKAVIYSSQSKFVNNIYGIKEIQSAKEYTEKIDVAVVPGIAFDKKGNRIGHGKGYYDKFFYKRNMCKIGLCYSENLSDEIFPFDIYDIPMDYIITDSEEVKIKS